MRGDREAHARTAGASLSSADADEVPEAQDMAEPETAVESEPEKTGDDEVDWEAVLLDGFETGGQREESEQREWYEPVTVDTKHLSDHLTEQLSLIEMSPREAILADDFVGNISDDGYLACPLEVIQRGVNEWLEAEAEERDAEVTPFSDDDMQSMLTIIQELDPPGVGARDLRECLIESSPDPIAYIHDGMHIRANESYLQMFGYADFDELEGMPILDLVDESQQKNFKIILKDFAKTKQYRYECCGSVGKR